MNNLTVTKKTLVETDSRMLTLCLDDDGDLLVHSYIKKYEESGGSMSLELADVMCLDSEEALNVAQAIYGALRGSL